MQVKAFPYCNGGLFAEKNIEIPRFNDELAELILKHASDDFDWSQISPTIFGAVFESTLNPETRRKGGMHYTSIENIHKVIDPLFLDDLKAELEHIKAEPVERNRRRRAHEYQDKLASLKFLDPACGSGNFLTETYLSLRRLENEAITLQVKDAGPSLGEEFTPIKVDIHQFYGIEINDFAVATATTALWIAEAQMMMETERIMQIDLDFLPLKSYNNIKEGNALRIDWNEVVPASELNYIMGNPPFVGYSFQDENQKKDMLAVFVDSEGKTLSTAGKIDYVAGWYYKAAKLMFDAASAKHTIYCALVSTNSITQGEQVPFIWEPLLKMFNVHIDFAWRTFRWDSEANLKAHVHCVIIGFSIDCKEKPKYLFSEGNAIIVASNISPYLISAPDVIVSSRSKPLCDVPAMVNGNKPVDGGYLFLNEEERQTVLSSEPQLVQFIKPVYGSAEYINNIKRYCFWLVNVPPNILRHSPILSARINAVRDYRLVSPKVATRKSADIPTLFQQIRQPSTTYILIPRVSSENRRYVPMGFLAPDIIANDSAQMVPNASIYHFGVLTSSVHMFWMRTVCGRLEMRYRYSNDIVYNNFPWPTPTEAQKAKIEETAQAILDARALYPDCSLADLYDELTMPIELRKAHQENDKAVMEAYGFNWRTMSESDCVAELFKLYQKLTETK